MGHIKTLRFCTGYDGFTSIMGAGKVTKLGVQTQTLTGYVSTEELLNYGFRSFPSDPDTYTVYHPPPAIAYKRICIQTLFLLFSVSAV